MDCTAVSAMLATLLAWTTPALAAPTRAPTVEASQPDASKAPTAKQTAKARPKEEAKALPKAEEPRPSKDNDAKAPPMEGARVPSKKEPRATPKASSKEAARRTIEESAPSAAAKKAGDSADGKVGDDAGGEESPSPAPPDSEASLASPSAEAGIDPKRGRSERRVEDERAPASEPGLAGGGSADPSDASPAAKTGPARKTKPGGRSSPATQSTRRGAPDALQRRSIAQGVTEDELRAGKDDPELRSLKEAEWVLFPQPLPGLVPGWSWDLPHPVESELPEIVSGAPAASRAAEAPRVAAPSAPWLSGLSMPNLPVRLEERVIRYLSFYRDSPSGRAIGRAWAKKRGRYSGALRAELARAGLPTDLVWLSLIESGHNPTIVSPAGAAGLWQFMPDAGRAYGLVIDRWVDERLDPERSTQAACRYLSDLYRRFGSWELAMAAYNMGYGGVSRAIRKYNTNNFWELARYEAGMPWETSLYVPKILATAIAMNNRRAFGLEDVEPDAPERFDTVLVGSGIPLSELARIAGVPLPRLETLNPQYLAGRTPPSAKQNMNRSWPVRVPVGRGASVHEALARDVPSDESLLTYLVRTGDTVESIAQALRTSEALIRFLNGVDSKEVLVAGTILLVPQGERGSEVAVEENLVVVPPRDFSYANRRRVFYRVVAGDSLARLAEVFAVPPSDLMAWNAVDENARLHPGMTLQVFVAESRDLSRVRTLAESSARILVAGSNDFFAYFEAQNGKRRFVVCAKPADSLATIGKRYGMGVASMERVNRRSRSDPVLSGEAIVVYTERTLPVPGDTLYDGLPANPADNVRSDAPGGTPAISELSTSGG